ncbi:hypothetical protein [Ktedonospora formicarum]|uniref:hypothetical protein n=1 Tax=Ktedonospora formicarum TaxID=2778364 RepID=UPI001C6917A3|nr:hypothetical protein [Ktedonospora formicarum]
MEEGPISEVLQRVNQVHEEAAHLAQEHGCCDRFFPFGIGASVHGDVSLLCAHVEGTARVGSGPS